MDLIHSFMVGIRVGYLISMSHFFANDTLLFCDSKEVELRWLRSVLCGVLRFSLVRLSIIVRVLSLELCLENLDNLAVGLG